MAATQQTRLSTSSTSGESTRAHSPSPDVAEKVSFGFPSDASPSLSTTSPTPMLLPHLLPSTIQPRLMTKKSTLLQRQTTDTTIRSRWMRRLPQLRRRQRASCPARKERTTSRPCSSRTFASPSSVPFDPRLSCSVASESLQKQATQRERARNADPTFDSLLLSPSPPSSISSTHQVFASMMLCVFLFALDQLILATVRSRGSLSPFFPPRRDADLAKTTKNRPFQPVCYLVLVPELCIFLLTSSFIWVLQSYPSSKRSRKFRGCRTGE